MMDMSDCVLEAVEESAVTACESLFLVNRFVLIYVSSTCSARGEEMGEVVAEA